MIHLSKLFSVHIMLFTEKRLIYIVYIGKMFDYLLRVRIINLLVNRNTK
jgi:hypothetical protein